MKCSFCGKEKKDEDLLEGKDGSICRDCLVICQKEIGVSKKDNELKQQKQMKPHLIKKVLDDYLIGQDDAKKILAVAMYNHYKRVELSTDVEIQKSNILLIGPSGSGKTYLMEVLSKMMGVPMVTIDATTLTQAGYIGDDVQSILEKLLIQADGDVKRAETGIVYIDEIDKIAKEGGDNHGNKGLGEGTQQALLKMLEGADVEISQGKNMFQKRTVINTKNILFVCGGAFVGIEDIVKNRVSKKGAKVGFATSDREEVDTEQSKSVEQVDVVTFGLIPEFVGRVSVIAHLEALSKEDLKDILTKPKNALVKQYKALLSADEVAISFEEDALDYIAEQAIKKGLGARGLKAVLERAMYDIMYQVPQKEVEEEIVITKEVLQGKTLIF